ncbi:putative apolipoprotein(a)-like protein 2 [Haliotis rufescens]|uniref:putative apolipoprotein(a)-like protein 2 n=1 Tax=Haliotis rufescens TaxID=6454 RepID=UPI00201EAF50|nr:putative apolipoprotein(a)-like protein 2 [Haliotis rufescens]
MARLLLLAIVAVLSTLAACNTDCYTKQGRTAVYSGTKSVTASGKTCQSWSSTSPNNHAYFRNYFDITNGAQNLGYAGAANYCRDPSGGNILPSGYLWCYLAYEQGWEQCAIHKCT